jgi:(1->4)-alpha-D-glucan 1-alpha-D-glucosylmutase
MQLPASTYRLQFHKGFNFQDLQSITDYLKTLGVSTIYAAPILKSTPGSMHGYDVIDPHVIDPEIGDIEQLKYLSDKLRELKIQWLQDIVPNHMAFSTKNQRLMDVLERGPASPYYNYFDINWNHPTPHLNSKLAVPFLGKELEESIHADEIKLLFDSNGFTVNYFETSYPLSLPAYHYLSEGDAWLKKRLEQFLRKGEAIQDLDEWMQFKSKTISSWMADEQMHKAISAACTAINEDKDILSALLNGQHYLLMYWKRSEHEINYRRFFTVNELICLRMEDEKVFDEYHTFIHQLYKQKLIHGVRIDHIDGLYDPAGYVARLRKLLGKECYIIAEKILETKESMPGHWVLEGTSGYEFLSFVNQLVTDRQGATKLVNLYKELIPDLKPYSKMVFDNKRLILENYMAGEWDNLLHDFDQLDFRDYDPVRMREGIALLMLSLPVYRIYPEKLPLEGIELKIVNEAFQKARDNGSDYAEELRFLEALFTTDLKQQDQDKTLKFLKRLMQFTGPLTAKGVEDTTFYVYNPLISHDEVGDAPSTLGISIDSFHAKMIARQKATPYSLNATSTHDTKRGEDARLRLNVLSEMPDVWESHVKQWIELNKNLKKEMDGRAVPSMNDEYFIYQSLVGGFPENLQVDQEFFERFNTFLVKAIREAKVNSNWSEPNEAYEEGCKSFVQNLFKPDHGFASHFEPFIEVVIHLVSRIFIKGVNCGI